MYEFELDLKTLRTMRHQNQDSEAVGTLVVLLTYQVLLTSKLKRLNSSLNSNPWYHEAAIRQELTACENALASSLNQYFRDGREHLRAAETIREEA